MVVFSLLRQSTSKCLQHIATNGCALKSMARPNTVLLAVIRGMAEKRTMKPIPSRMEWEMFKDQFHLYLMVGAIPVVAIMIYANIFVESKTKSPGSGQAELADIPEGYEPKHWEYHKHPIKRFFARYLYDPPERDYERFMHQLFVDNEVRKNRLLEWKARDLMGRRQDYKGWYWIPVDATRIEKAGRTRDSYDETIGSN